MNRPVGTSLTCFTLLAAWTLALGLWTHPATAQPASQPVDSLEAAVATLRHIDRRNLSDEEGKRKAMEIERAWATIKAAGKPGLERLKREVQAAERETTKDRFFQLNASALLWQIAGLDEAQTIAAIWRTTPLNVQYNYVFGTAFEAAETQDPRALPILLAILADDQGVFFIVEHALQLRWPLNHMFIWERFGPKGLPALRELLQESEDPIELTSALILVTRAQNVEALPRIRELAKASPDQARQIAIECLGGFGHPADYELLLEGLKSGDDELRAAHVRALAVYGDLRAAPELIGLLSEQSQPLRQEAIWALDVLRTPDSLEALRAQSSKTDGTTPDEREACRDIVNDALAAMQTDWDAYAAKTRQEKEALIAAANRQDEKYQLREGDRKLTRKEFIRAAKGWKRAHRITGGKYKWIEDRHVLAVATPADIDLLLEVRAACYARLSDECLYEVQTLNRLMHRIGRSRYRQVVGVCPKVELKAAPTTAPAPSPTADPVGK
ncbi:MAG: HEAT repeat domain-containing protein [Phycisphaerae bacterium]|nr:HEAT repeat domain-containing protein [Phycisphaerae bacterium]